MPHTLCLASQSPRRAALIKLLGVSDIMIQPSDIHEAMDPELHAGANVRMLAEHKARHVADQIGTQARVILGADTTVAIGDAILNKPESAEEAERMLMRLSGKTHTVYTGVALINSETREELSFVESTDVTFRKLEPSEIRAYVASGSPMDKAGAYGIQEDFGAVFVRQIDGDYYTVVGLPVCRLYVALKEFAPEVFV